MKPANPQVRDDHFTGELFTGNKRTGELFMSVFKNGVEVDRIGPIPPEQITPEMTEFLPPSFTQEGAN
jgi:hypothetical protein